MYRKKSRQPALLGKIIIVGFIGAGLLTVYFYNQFQYFIYTPVNPQNTENIIVSIKKGDTSKQIAEQLFQKHLILNQDAFKLYTKLNNIDKDLKTGRFPLNQSENIPEITKTLTSDSQRQEVVTIPEGSSTEEIGKILTDLNLGQPGEFEKATQNFSKYSKYSFLVESTARKLTYPLEGYLFPDTYYINPNEFSNEGFISQLLNTFAQKAAPIIAASKQKSSDIINVAAMVEKEANKDQDRPIIAGIIWKRLEQNWPLGIDATLLYLKKDRNIEYQDLKKDGDYNTRTRTGLPLGPITNPGLASIKAAANPELTEYFFYLTSREGKMIYAKTNAEHNINKSKYL